jgi:hypothetical protein
VDRFDADGIGVFGPESTNPATPPGGLKNTSIRRSGMVVTERIIMRVTLHQGASNPYYGQWRPEKTAISGPQIEVHCP